MHASISDIKAHIAANRALLPDVVAAGGRAEIAVTFVPLVTPDWFRAWATANGFQAREAQLELGGGTGMGVFGKVDDPLPQSGIDAAGIGADAITGVFGAYGTVDAKRLPQLAADPHVALLDVTPAWMRTDLKQAGITATMSQPVLVDLPYGYMERMGLQNFTSLPVPTPAPPPVSTIVPTIPPVVTP